MTRPVDWSPLAGSDPVPGDVHRTRSLATRYSSTAQEIREQVQNLRTLGENSDYWHADSGRTFSKHARELAGKVDKAQHRYTVVRDALRAWADDLEDVQHDADGALVRAKDAQRRIDAEAHTAPGPRTTTGQTPAQIEAGAAADAAASAARAERIRQAVADLDAARKALSRAVHTYDVAGRAAKRRIEDGLDEDPMNDSRWDKVKDVALKGLTFVTEVAGWISTIAGVLGLVCMFIPGLQGLGAALLTIAQIAAYVSAAGHLVLAATGQGSWGEFLLDVFSIAVLGGAIKGLGALGKAVKATTAAERSATRAARDAAARSARERAARTGKAAASTGRRSGTKGNRAVAQAARQEERRAARAAATREREQLARTRPQAPAAAEGSEDLAREVALAQARAAAARAPHDPAVQALLRDAERAMLGVRGLTGVGVAVDVAGKEDGLTVPGRAEPVDMFPGVDKKNVFAGVNDRLVYRVVPLP